MEISRNLFDDLSYRHDLRLKDKYEGRGMYGKKCLAVVGGTRDLVQLVAAVTEEVEDRSTARGLVAALAGARTDNLGYDQVFYFPEVTVASETDDE